MQNIFLKSAYMGSLIRSHGVVLGWLPSDENSPFAEKLWQGVLEEAATGGEIRISSRVIETTLETSPSDCLFSRKRRRELSDALGSLVPVIPGKEEKLVASIIQFHREALESNSGICRLGKYHDILYVAAYLAEQFRIDDNSLVSQLLKEMFYCEQSFDRLVAPAILGPKVSHILSGWRPDLENESRALFTLEYFALHSNAARLEFRIKGDENQTRRFLDVPLLSLQGTPPLTVATQANEVEAVRLLLRHGAELGLYGVFCPLRASTQRLSNYARSVLDRKSCECSERTRQSLHKKDYETLKKHSLCSSKTLTPDEWMDILYATAFSWDPSFTMCECERTTSILWPEPSIQILRLLMSCVGKKRVFQNPKFFHPRLFTDGLVTCSPPSLKDLSRLSVRRILHRNWNLPNGTRELGLPPVLINYLNFEKDEV